MNHKSTLFFISLIFFSPLASSQTGVLSNQDSAATAASDGRVKVKFPWTVHSFDRNEISRFPFRGTENYLPLVPGVVHLNNEFYMRGSRSYETGYFIGGINVTNPMFGSNGVPLIPEAMEALEVHTGAYSATMGSYNGGIVSSRMRRGGDTLSIHVDIQSDKFRSQGQRFLNTTVQGYQNVVGTIGGPLPLFDIHFFLAGERTTFANRQPMFLEPFRYENLVDDGGWSFLRLGQPLPGPVGFTRDWIPGNQSGSSVVQGNVSAELLGVSLTGIGSYEETDYPVGSEWPNALTNYFNQSRNMLTRTKARFGAIQASSSIGDIATVTLSYSFIDRYSKTFDPVFKDNWLAYSDRNANARYFDTSQWGNRYRGQYQYSTIYFFYFNFPGTPNTTYSKNRQEESRWAIDATSELFPSVTLKAGGSIDSWTMRSFKVGNIASLLRFLDQDYDGIIDATFSNQYAERVYYIESANISSFGYDFLGRQTEGYSLPGEPPNAVLDQPYKPTFTSAYLEGTVQSEDLELKAGVRYERYDPQLKSATLHPIFLGEYDVDYNAVLGIMDESQIEPSDPVSFLLPRVNVSFRPSERTRIYGGYGVFARMPVLNPLYMSSYSFSRVISLDDRSPYSFAGSTLPSFNVTAEKSRQFEFGIEQTLTRNVTMRANAYYKVLSHQLQFARFFDPAGEHIFNQYGNDGNGLARGLEIECEVKNETGFSALFHYAYSTAQGITSSPTSNSVLFSDAMLPPTPITLRPYDYQQTHQLTLVLDAKTAKEKGLFLGGIEATAVLTARSGHPYTRQNEIQSLGSWGPWNVGVAMIQDPRFSLPLEAHNASTTPPMMNIDIRIAKTFDFDIAAITIFIDVLNLLNTKNTINVYPTTGTTNDDSWLNSQYSEYYRQVPNYESFYRDINLKNRWAYMGATGNDLFGPPRQIRFGVHVLLGGRQ